MLKKVTGSTTDSVKKSVTLCLQSQVVVLNGLWKWDMQSNALYCSDVMSFPENFEGTKAIIHPDDIHQLTCVFTLIENDELTNLDFRIITTYGEVKTISGKNISVDAPSEKIKTLFPGKELWEEALEHLSEKKENDFLQLRSVLTEITERLHNIGSYLLSKTNSLAWYSDNVFRIYKLAPQSLNAHAHAFNLFIHADDRELVLDAFEKAFRDELPLEIEYRISLPDGETKFVQHITRWLFDAKGHLLCCGIIRDVSSERAVVDELLKVQGNTSLHQQLLKFSEQQFDIAYWYVNLVTRKVFFSDNYWRIFGMKPSNHFSLQSFLNLVHVDDREIIKTLYEKMYAEYVMPDSQFRIIRPDGKTRYLRQNGRFLVDPNKEPVMIGVVRDITVQRKLEIKISNLNESFSVNKLIGEAAETIYDISSIIWNDGSLQASEGFLRMSGIKPLTNEDLTKTIDKIVYPDDKKIWKEIVIDLIKHQTPGAVVIRIISKKGIKSLRVSFVKLNNEKEIIVGLAEDVTAQTAMQQKFNENKLFSDLLLDSVNDIILFTNTDHTITNWNEKAERKTGIKKENALYQNLFDVLPSLKNDQFTSQLKSALNGEEIHSLLSDNGYLSKPYQYWLLPLKNEEANVIGVLHVIHDISRQLQLQSQLHERLNFIENLVGSSVDRIVALDREMNYLYWNKKAEEYYELKREDVIGKNVLEVFPSASSTPEYDYFKRVLKGETIHLPASNEANLHEVYLLPVKNAKEEIYAILWIEHDLSKEITSEQRLKEQAQLLETVFNASMDGVILFRAVRNEEGTITDYEVLMDNVVTQKWNGKSLVGKKYAESFPSIKATGLFDAYNRVIETGESLDTEMFYEGQGFKNWFRITAVRLDNDKLVSTAEDITARKTIEQALNESRSQLEQIAKASPDSITIYDLKKRQPVYLNTCLAEWISVCNKDLIEMGPDGRLKLIHPDDRLNVLQFNEKIAAANDGQILTLEYRIKTSKEKMLWIRNRSKIFMRNDTGTVTHLLSILQNVTEEIEMGEELKRRTQFAETVLDASTNRVTVFDRNYRFIAWNKRCEEIHGKTQEQVIGKTIFEMFPGVENNPVFMNAQDQALKGEYVHVPSVQDGYTGAYLELFYVPLKNEWGETYAVLNIMHDVTTYVKQTEALDALNKKLETKNAELAQKNEEITHFSFVASHDMKEPLRKIHTFSDWLLNEESEYLSPKGKTLVEKINEAVKRMNLLIEDILVLTKINSDTHQEEHIDLNNVLQKVLDDLSDKIRQTQTEVISEHLPVIKANDKQLFYLFKNLITNAIKFQKPGNVPQIKITAEIVSGKKINFRDDVDEYLKLSFIDNGFGFDSRYAKKIFQVFQRLHGKQEFEGTGIGLAISKKIMENHRGFIDVETEEGRGSTFICYFPF